MFLMKTNYSDLNFMFSQLILILSFYSKTIIRNSRITAINNKPISVLTIGRHLSDFDPINNLLYKILTHEKQIEGIFVKSLI